MEWLIDEFDIDATFAISVHDQIRYLSSKEDADRKRDLIFSFNLTA